MRADWYKVFQKFAVSLCCSSFPHFPVFCQSWEVEMLQGRGKRTCIWLCGGSKVHLMSFLSYVRPQLRLVRSSTSHRIHKKSQSTEGQMSTSCIGGCVACSRCTQGPKSPGRTRHCPLSAKHPLPIFWWYHRRCRT